LIGLKETFVPIAQSKEANSNNYFETKAIPHLKMRLGGVLQNTAPEQAPVSPHLTIWLNGIVQSVIPLSKQQRTVLDDNEDIMISLMVETCLKKLNNLFLKTLRLMPKMVLTGCLKKERSNQMIQVMSFSLHHTRNKFFKTFLSTSSLLNVMENGLLNKFTGMLYMRCIASVIFKVLEKYGGIYGHAGIHPKCGKLWARSTFPIVSRQPDSRQSYDPS